MMAKNQFRAERSVGWVYHWLFWSVLITVPWMSINLSNASYRPSTLTYVAAVLWPALIHLFVLPWNLKSPSRYVRRHTQQAFLLTGLRTLSAVLFIGLTRGEAACLWFLANGGLWLGGSVWGWRQIKRGDCWLMRRKGEGDELPRPWAEGVETPEPALPETAGAQTETPSQMDAARMGHWQRQWRQHKWHKPTTAGTQLLKGILADGETLFFYRQRGVICDRTSCHLAMTDQRLILLSPKRPPAVIGNVLLTDSRLVAIEPAGGAVRRLMLHLPHQEISLIAANQKIAADFATFLRELQAIQTAATPVTPQASLTLGQTRLGQGRQDEAVSHFLAAFRLGTADLRQQAVIELEKLDEVEAF